MHQCLHEPRVITADASGAAVVYGVCAGCHAYNALDRPPALVTGTVWQRCAGDRRLRGKPDTQTSRLPKHAWPSQLKCDSWLLNTCWDSRIDPDRGAVIRGAAPQSLHRLRRVNRRTERCGYACQFIKPDYASLETSIHGRQRSTEGDIEPYFEAIESMHQAALTTPSQGANGRDYHPTR